jgi:iron(III) transport system ATP-binding protein
MVFQSYALWPHMTVRSNVAFGLEERRLPRAEIARRVEAALDRVGLSALADRRPSQLSGGQQQRVAIARVLAQQSQILLADEPVASLDPESARQVLRTLRGIARDQGIAVLCSLHQVDLAREFAREPA